MHRLGARAIVLHNGCILLNEFSSGYYNIPGGGMEQGESARDTAKREVLEESGIDVEVDELLFVLEYNPVVCNNMYGTTPTFSFVFAAEPIGSTSISPPTIPDINPDDPSVIGHAVWLPLEKLPNIELFPHINQNILDYAQCGRFTPSFICEPYNIK